ncbi:MAG TPA: DUF2059 domain-containing protein [Flavobacterium sp.]|jgi:hypothetical protein
MKKIILTLVLVLAAQISFAQDDAFKKDVYKVIEATGAMASITMYRDQMAASLAADKKEAFQKEFDALLPPLYDKIAVIYMDVYSKDDIKAMLTFYNSPVGKKITAASGDIAKRSMVAGQEIGPQLQALMMKYMQ